MVAVNMLNTEWIVVLTCMAAVVRTFVYGANMPVNCWGPSVGAKAVSYKTAVILGLIGQTVGMVAFGPETYSAYGQFLDARTEIALHPLLTMYALMWIIIVPVVWHILAIWQKMLLPVYLGTVASTVGAGLIFPGPTALNFGHFNSISNFSGLGTVIAVWLLAPPLTMCLLAVCFVAYRSLLFRGEDAFHKVMWNLPIIANWTAAWSALLLMYAIGSPNGTTWFQTSPQGTVIIIVSIGTAANVLMCFGVNYVSNHLRKQVAAPVVYKKMSLLGLDDEVVKELAAEDVPQDMKGRLQRLYTRCFTLDLLNPVASSDALLRIHSTAEDYRAPAEESAFIPIQIVFSFFLSVTWGANNSHTAPLIFQMVKAIHTTGAVPNSVNLGIAWRCASAVGMAIGTLLWGSRLTPVTAVRIAKLTPFRSNALMGFSTQIVALLGVIQLKGGVITYCILSSVIAIGLVEGTSHVNWKVVCATMLWWVIGFFLVLAVTSACVAQGLYAPTLLPSGVAI